MHWEFYFRVLFAEERKKLRVHKNEISQNLSTPSMRSDCSA